MAALERESRSFIAPLPVAPPKHSADPLPRSLPQYARQHGPLVSLARQRLVTDSFSHRPIHGPSHQCTRDQDLRPPSLTPSRPSTLPFRQVLDAVSYHAATFCTLIATHVLRCQVRGKSSERRLAVLSVVLLSLCSSPAHDYDRLAPGSHGSCRFFPTAQRPRESSA